VEIAPSILYLMAGAFSAGVMWQALSSDGNRANLENMLMLPFEGRTLVFSYVAALGAYTLLTKTAGLLAVVWAVSEWSWAEILGSVLCALAAVVIVSCLYPLRLGRTDAYAFYVQPASRRRTVKVRRRSSVWRYLFRYLMAHKNYLVNTAAMWGVACVLPVLLGQMEARFVLPIGFAILSLNTPICILLSCDPASSTHPWPVMAERRKERASMEMAAPASTSRNMVLTGIRLISAHLLSIGSRCRRLF